MSPQILNCLQLLQNSWTYGESLHEEEGSSSVDWHQVLNGKKQLHESSMNNLEAKIGNITQLQLQLKVNGRKLDVEVGTGAQHSIISTVDWTRIVSL
jgi:hypothetical protein